MLWFDWLICNDMLQCFCMFSLAFLQPPERVIATVCWGQKSKFSSQKQATSYCKCHMSGGAEKCNKVFSTVTFSLWNCWAWVQKGFLEGSSYFLTLTIRRHTQTQTGCFRANQMFWQNRSSPVYFNMLMWLCCDSADRRVLKNESGSPPAESSSRIDFCKNASQRQAAADRLIRLNTAGQPAKMASKDLIQIISNPLIKTGCYVLPWNNSVRYLKLVRF